MSEGTFIGRVPFSIWVLRGVHVSFITLIALLSTFLADRLWWRSVGEQWWGPGDLLAFFAPLVAQCMNYLFFAVGIGSAGLTIIFFHRWPLRGVGGNFVALVLGWVLGIFVSLLLMGYLGPTFGAAAFAIVSVTNRPRMYWRFLDLAVAIAAGATAYGIRVPFP